MAPSTTRAPSQTISGLTRPMGGNSTVTLPSMQPPSSNLLYPPTKSFPQKQTIQLSPDTISPSRGRLLGTTSTLRSSSTGGQLVPPSWAQSQGRNSPLAAAQSASILAAPPTGSTLTLPSSQTLLPPTGLLTAQITKGAGSTKSSSESTSSRDGLVYIKSPPEKSQGICAGCSPTQVGGSTSVKRLTTARDYLAEGRDLIPADKLSSAGRRSAPFSESVSVSVSTAWDLKSGYMRAARTGPTGWPSHIQAEEGDFKAANPSPLLMYYYDESAPNDVLLNNDVMRTSPTRAVRHKLKKLLTCNAGKERKFKANAEEYSVSLPDDLPLSTADEYISQDSRGLSSYTQKQEQPRRAACTPCGVRPGSTPEPRSEEGSLEEFSGSYSTDPGSEPAEPQKVANRRSLGAAPVTQSSLAEPGYPSRATEGSSTNLQNTLDTIGGQSANEKAQPQGRFACPHCNGTGVIYEPYKRQTRWCDCTRVESPGSQESGPRSSLQSANGRTRVEGLSGAPRSQGVLSSLCTCGVAGRGGEQDLSDKVTATEGCSCSECASTADLNSEENRESQSQQPQQLLPPENADLLAQMFVEEPRPVYRPCEKKEGDRDLGYHVRRMFFDAEKEQSQPDTEYQMCPTYSVSYRNYPYICYDAVVPTTYSEFFREKQRPMNQCI